jgi:hypothetical protein
MSDDIFAIADKEPDAFTSMTESKPANTFRSKKENYWDKQDIQPMEIDVTKFKKTGKSFTIFVHPENDMPEDIYKKLLAVSKVIMEQGYTFRHTGNKDNALHNAILKLEGAKVESYMPWKKFNPNVESPKMSTPTGYRVAIGIHRAFMRLPAAVRAILSKDTNALLGTEATDPVDFVLAWTDGGAEVLAAKADFKKIGNNTFILQVCSRANITVLNAYNSNFIERIKAMLKPDDVSPPY